jgi:hypothetical protein
MRLSSCSVLPMSTREESRRRTEAQILDRMIRDFDGFAMVIECPCCPGERTTTVHAFAERWGNLTFRQMIAKMACKTCGNKPIRLTITHHVARWELVRPAH